MDPMRAARARMCSACDELVERHPAARSTATGQTVMLSNAILMLDDLTVGHDGEAADANCREGAVCIKHGATARQPVCGLGVRRMSPAHDMNKRPLSR